MKRSSDDCGAPGSLQAQPGFPARVLPALVINTNVKRTFLPTSEVAQEDHII